MIRRIIQNGSKIFSRRQSNIFSAAAILAFAFGLSALLGILRDRLLYARFYSCCAADLDAYNAAFRLPDIIFRLLVTGALSAAFIPVFSQQLHKDKKAAFKTASSVLTILFSIFFLLSLAIIIFAYPLSDLITLNFSKNQLGLMAKMTQLMTIAQLFFLVSNFITGILQSNQLFLIPSLAPVMYNLGIIFGIQFLGSKIGILGPAVGVVIGSILHLLVQIPSLIATKFKYSFIFSFKLSGVRQIIKLMLPRTLALGLGEIESTVAMFLATILPTGELSLFYLAQRLTYFFSRIFGVTIGQASLPVFSKEAGVKSFSKFNQIFLSSLLQAVFFAFPAAAIFLVLRVPIVRLAYGAENFPWGATLTTGRVIIFFVPLVIAGTANDILIRGFYALQDTKTPLSVSFASLIINITTALLAIFKFNLGVFGLAMSVSLAGVFRSLALTVILVKRIKLQNTLADLVMPMAKMVLAALIGGLISWLGLRSLDLYLIDTTRIGGLIILSAISALLGLIIYFCFCLWFKIKEASRIIKFVQRFLVWPKSASTPVELPPFPQ